MTLDTRVYIHSPVDRREVFLKCNQLLGAHEGIEFREDAYCIMNEPAQGLDAWLIVYYASNAGQPVQVEVSFDTAYSHEGPDGGCGDLHARLVGELGAWLDGKGLAWSWKNEFTGEVRQGHEGLAELGSCS